MEASVVDRKTVEIILEIEQAIVLFELLAQGRLVEAAVENSIFDDIEAQLERVLVEPLSPNYKQLLDRARDKIRASIAV